MLLKKVLASTLSAGLVLSTLTVVPLNSKGLLELSGVHTASAAIDLSGIGGKLTNVEANLTDTEKAEINAARDKLLILSDASVVSDISGKVGTATDADLLELFKILGFFFSANEAGLTNALSAPEMRTILDKVAAATGLDLAVSDAVAFTLALGTQLLNQVKGKTLLQLGALALSESLMKAEIKTAITTVMDDPTLKFSQALDNLHITADEVASLTNKIALKVDPERKAIVNLAIGIIRADTALTISSGNLSNSRTVVYALTVADKAVPNAAIKWTSSNDDLITATEDDSNKVTLSMPNGSSATTTLTAAIDAPDTPIDGVVLITRSITMNVEAPVIIDPIDQTPAIEDIDKAKDLADKIKDAAPEEKAALVAELKKAVETTAASLSTIDLSKSITVEGDKATSHIDTVSVVEQIKKVAEEIKKLNDLLKAADPTAAPVKTALTFNFGSPTTKTTEITLPKGMIDAVKDAGVSDIKLKSDGVGLTVKSTTFSSDTKVTVTKQDDSVAKTESNQRLVSNVVDVEFTSGNQKITNFSDPVQLSLPVIDTTGVDTEKLVVGKIVDGKIQPVGGKYNATDKQVSTNRNSFSLYTVIENNVTFDDIASVRTWAGRQIEVAAAKGIVEGRAEGSFVPNATVTRAEFTKMIVNTFGILDEAAQESFGDVGDNDWFKPYVASAVKAGLINGRADGSFDPNGLITRAEMATIAARALTQVNGVSNTVSVDSVLQRFSDTNQVAASLKADVALAVDLGIIIGDAGKLNPKGNSTRAQAAVVIYRLLNQ